MEQAKAVEDSAPPTKAGVVAEKLRRLIQSGEIAPGSRRRQNEVAERYDMSGTPRLASIVASLRKTPANYINLTVPNPEKDNADQVHAQHEEILMELRARQAERAARAVRTHLQTTVERVTSLMTHESQPTSKTERTHADRPRAPQGHDRPTG
jgi:DNA-binding GntR family transcriptional regulator